MEQTKLITSADHFSVFSHRGFGEKAYARYANKKILRFVHNQLTGLELGIENGADALELDLSKTKDGKIVTAHGNPLQKHLPFTEQEYLSKIPEALTIQELLDWHYHSIFNPTLYLELKSSITIHELINEISKYAKDNSAIIQKFCQCIMIYTHDLSIIKELIKEKQQLGLSTLQLRIFWVSLGFITTEDIDRISYLGTKEDRIYGIEQGTVPWGFKPFVSFLHLSIPPFLQFKKRLQNLDKIVTYAHEKNLKFIVGTVDDTELIRMLIEKHINGIVPNNPLNIYKVGIIKEKKQKNQQEKYYVPLSMQKRFYSE